MSGPLERLRAKRRARQLAAQLWRQYRDVERCKVEFEGLAKSDPQLVGLDPATILMLVQLAIKLWLWWREQQEDDPADEPELGEPWQEDTDDVG